MLNVKDYRLRDVGSDIRRMYEFNGTTPRGERVVAEISECYPSDGKGWGKYGLPTLWHKHGYTEEVLPSYLCLTVWAYDENGQCWGMYNPQHMLAWDGKRGILDFDWVLPVSQENVKRLLAEVVRRANEGVEPKRELMPISLG